MRKSRERRRGAAMDGQLSDIDKVASPNPRRVAVVCPELDMQEGLLGLLGNVNRSNSIVEDLGEIYGDIRNVEGGGEDSHGDGCGERRRFIPEDVDVDNVKFLQEIRKRSSQMTADDEGEGEKGDLTGRSDFFMTHGEKGEAAIAEDGEDDTGDDGESQGRPSIAPGLPGLAEFQRRMGVVRGKDRRGSESGGTSEDESDTSETETKTKSQPAKPKTNPGQGGARPRTALANKRQVGVATEQVDGARNTKKEIGENLTKEKSKGAPPLRSLRQTVRKDKDRAITARDSISDTDDGSGEVLLPGLAEFRRRLRPNCVTFEDELQSKAIPE